MPGAGGSPVAFYTINVLHRRLLPLLPRTHSGLGSCRGREEVRLPTHPARVTSPPALAPSPWPPPREPRNPHTARSTVQVYWGRGAAARHPGGAPVRWPGNRHPPAGWTRWSCRCGRSAGRGWHPPRVPRLRARQGSVWGCAAHWCPPSPCTAHLSPANLPSGMRSSMVLAFCGSLQLA